MSATTSTIERPYVIRALERVERGERDSLDELRSALCAYVGALRSEGADREAAKRAVTELIMTPAGPDGASRLLPPAREALVELATHWCAQEFSRD